MFAFLVVVCLFFHVSLIVFCLFVFCFVFQEALYGFGEEFFSLHSRRFRERSFVHVTESAKRDGREKNNCVFLLFLLLNFAFGAVSKIDLIFN